MQHYRNLDPSDISSDLRASAEQAVAAAANNLKLDPITIQWYKAVSSSAECDWSAEIPEFGHTQALHPTKVWLNVDQTPHQAVLTAAHEVKHLAQWRDGTFPRLAYLCTPTVNKESERDAETYARALADYLTNGGTVAGASLVRIAAQLLERSAVDELVRAVSAVLDHSPL